MKNWLKILLVVLSFTIISVIIYLIFRSYGITDAATIKSIILNTGNWGVFVYTILLIIFLVCLCFVPLLNIGMTAIGISIFGSVTAFISNIIAIAISTTILFLIGDKLGERFAKKLIGEKSFSEAQDIIDHKSKFWLPIFFIAPGIPDEAICLIAGMTKIKYWYLLLVSLIYHAVEIGLLAFIGSGVIDWAALSVLDWIIVSNLMIIDFYLLIKAEKFLDKKLKEKTK